MTVRPKKKLGQHFLTDLSIAQKIAYSLEANNAENVLEIGPGMGVLTDFLLKRGLNIKVIEIDSESVNYLEENYPELDEKIIYADFLNVNLNELYDKQLAIIGNFPYNISSQILFKVLDYKELIPEVVGMFQKEVAERIASKEGTKKYGILSVLMQAYYNVEYLFTVDEHVFDPPPKVKSGVLRITRKDNITLNCNEKLFKTIIKTGFNQRRKTLRNSLKPLLSDIKIDNDIMSKRPEQLSFERFIFLTNLVENSINNINKK